MSLKGLISAGLKELADVSASWLDIGRHERHTIMNFCSYEHFVYYVIADDAIPIDFSKAITGTHLRTQSMSFDPERRYCNKKKLENHSINAK